MRSVPRHEFVPENNRRYSYQDNPLTIGYGQTISQPYIVAYMTEALELEAGHKVLEIGTGSGYQAAVLAEAFGAAGIPHRVRGSSSLLAQPEVTSALRQLRSATAVLDCVADWERIVQVGADDTGTNYTDERLANIAELVRLGREYLALDPSGSLPSAYGDDSSTLRPNGARILSTTVIRA